MSRIRYMVSPACSPRIATDPWAQHAKPTRTDRKNSVCSLLVTLLPCPIGNGILVGLDRRAAPATHAPDPLITKWLPATGLPGVARDRLLPVADDPDQLVAGAALPVTAHAHV